MKFNKGLIKNLRVNSLLMTVYLSCIVNSINNLSVCDYHMNINSPQIISTSDSQDILLNVKCVSSEFLLTNESFVVDDNMENSIYEDVKVEETFPVEYYSEFIDGVVPVIEDLKNVYSGMALEPEFEDEIKQLVDLYGIPYQIVLAIGERESDGSWNNNGVISKTNDYGVFQINKCNLKYIEDNLGYTEEEILNDPIKNTEACLFLLNDIINGEGATTLEDIFGMYNGWVDWREKPGAVDYVNGCLEIMDKYFPDFEYCLDDNEKTLILK